MMAEQVRNRSLVVPREHGAWGILLVPLVSGAAIALLDGGSGASLVPFSLAALALFWLRTPVESWVGAAAIRARTPQEFRMVRNAAFWLSLVAAASLAWLFWGGRNGALLGIGCAAAASFAAQYAVKRISRGARAAAQMVGSAGLTATAAGAYYVVAGRLDATAWSLWIANYLFAVNQIQFVQLRIHGARANSPGEKLAIGRGFFAAQCLLAFALIAAASSSLFPWYAAAAFLPVLFRGFAWFAAKPAPLAIHALGKSELAYACVFGVLLIIGIRLG